MSNGILAGDFPCKRTSTSTSPDKLFWKKGPGTAAAPVLQFYCKNFGTPIQGCFLSQTKIKGAPGGTAAVGGKRYFGKRTAKRFSSVPRAKGVPPPQNEARFDGVVEKLRKTVSPKGKRSKNPETYPPIVPSFQKTGRVIFLLFPPFFLRSRQ